MQRITPAHTIVDLPEHFTRVPAYYRARRAPITNKRAGILQLPVMKHTPDRFHSAEWIAHNAAIEAKRPLLGKGPRPVLGSMYRSRMQTSPAFYAPAKRQRVDWRKVRAVAVDTMALIGAVVVLGAMYHVGAAVF